MLVVVVVHGGELVSLSIQTIIHHACLYDSRDESLFVPPAQRPQGCTREAGGRRTREASVV